MLSLSILYYQNNGIKIKLRTKDEITKTNIKNLIKSAKYYKQKFEKQKIDYVVQLSQMQNNNRKIIYFDGNGKLSDLFKLPNNLDNIRGQLNI